MFLIILKQKKRQKALFLKYNLFDVGWTSVRQKGNKLPPTKDHYFFRIEMYKQVRLFT